MYKNFKTTWRFRVRWHGYSRNTVSKSQQTKE